MKALLIVLVLAVFGLMVYAEYASTWSAAESACRKEIERSLSYPGDAEWVGVELSDRLDDYVTVSGTVAMPNTFGGSKHLPFECRVQMIGKEGFIRRATLDGKSVSTVDRLRRALRN